MKMTSPRMVLIRQDLTKVGKGALLAGFGAAVIYFLDNVTGVDFGDWNLIAAAVVSVVGNLFRKWWTENKYR